jgi:hypothetical protein
MDVFCYVHDFRTISRCLIGKGGTILFWKDLWHTNSLLCDQFSRLFSFALDEDITVGDMVGAAELTSMFNLPLSAQAYHELIQVQSYLQMVSTNDQIKDTRVFPWGSSSYTSSKFYNFVFAQAPTDHALQAIWKSKSLPELHFFSWLLMKDKRSDGQKKLDSR